MCGLVKVLFLSPLFNFLFYNNHFPVTTLGLDLFLDTFYSNLLCLLCPVIENNSV